MKILSTILMVSCILACSDATSKVKKIEDLLAENTRELSETKQLLHHIDNTNVQIKASIDQQRGWLVAIKNVEVLLAKQNLLVDTQFALLAKGLQNVSLTSSLHAERVVRELSALSRLQLSTKQQISALELKLDAYQKHVLESARGVENNILGLTKLVTRAVLPQLNGLQSSFNSLDTSQINIEVELKSLPRVKDITEDSNRKLIVLAEQLINLNQTQSGRLSVLSLAVSKLKPLNTWQIESALRELIISQKRIELDLEACQKRSSSHYGHPYGAETYPSIDIELTTRPRSSKPSNPRYTQVSGSLVKPGQHTTGAHAVSWQQPLPWEAVAAYQSPSGPGLIPKNSAIPWQAEPYYRINSAPAQKVYQPSSAPRSPGISSPSHSAPNANGPQYQQPGSKPVVNPQSGIY